jgi:hypothetical protein
VGSNPISSTKMCYLCPYVSGRSSIYAVVLSFAGGGMLGLPLKKPFANYLPAFRASQYERNRAFFHRQGE